MNTANAQSADIDLASSIAHAGIRARPKRELTFSLNAGNCSVSRPRQCLTAESDLSQFDPHYWHAQSAEEVDASEGVTQFLNFDMALIMPKQLTLPPGRCPAK